MPAGDAFEDRSRKIIIQISIYSTRDVCSLVIHSTLVWVSKLEPAVDNDPIGIIDMICQLVNRYDGCKFHSTPQFKDMVWLFYLYRITIDWSMNPSLESLAHCTGYLIIQ